MVEVHAVMATMSPNDYLEIVEGSTGELLFYGFRNKPKNKVYIATRLFDQYQVTDLSCTSIVKYEDVRKVKITVELKED